MKINIRKQVFETNSSSVHTLSINNTDTSKLDDIPTEQEIFLKEQEFGWEYLNYNSFKDKVDYIYTYIKNLYYEPSEKEKKEIENELQYLKSVILEVCPKIVISENKDTEGWIDHDIELNELWIKFKENKELLKQFLFCSDSVLITDNDNHSYDDEEQDEQNRKNSREDKGYFVYVKRN